MQTSWRTDDVLTELRPSATLRGMFEAYGRPIGTDGARPVSVDDRRAVWLVTEGAVDLFFVECVGGVPVARRRHVARIPAGEIVCGVASIETEGGCIAGLVAVGTRGAVLRRLTWETFDSRAASGELFGAVQRWAVRLSECDARLVPADHRDLDAFHRNVMVTLVNAAREQRELERAQYRDRSDRSARAVDDSLRRLARRRALDAPSSQDPVVDACSRVLAATGITPTAPIASATTRSPVAKVEACARAAHVRHRPVSLPHGWQDEESGPLLAFTEADRTPIALTPRSGGYDAYDPTTRETVRVDDTFARSLAPQAFVFYRPFPARRLGLFDVARFSVAGSVSDLAAVVLIGLAIGALQMLVPYATGLVVDAYVPTANGALVVQVGVGLVAVAVAIALADLARQTAALRVQTRASSLVQSALWDRVLALPVPFFRRFSAGDLAARIEGIDKIREALSGATLGVVLSSLSSLMSFFLLVHYGPGLALVAGALGLGSLTIALAFGVTSVLLHRRIATIDGRLASYVLQLVGGVSKLRVAGATDRAFAVWAREHASKRELTVRAEKVQAGFAVVESVYPIFTTVVLFWLVADATATGALTTGEFIGFNAAFTVFLHGLLGLVSVAVTTLHVVPLYERARPILEATPEVSAAKAQPGALTGEIQVSHASFRYRADGPLVLDDIDLNIAPGEMVAIVGASASGKSTLMRLLLGFESPESGSVFYDGQDLASLDASLVRRQMGVVLQHGELIAGTIFENIVGSRDLGLDDAWAAAEMAGLKADIEAMPMGMHTVVSEGGRSLSGGQRQRVLIARALVIRPRVVLFDEATSALDRRTQAIVSESLERLEATRIVIAHRHSTVRHADRLVVLDHGRIVETGTYDELMARRGVFYALAARQLA